jgi:23S rRNA (uracil1939-C5)-methyltransferase
MRDYSVSGYNEKNGKGLLRHVYLRIGKRSGEINVCLVINGSNLPHAKRLTSLLKTVKGITGICLNVNTKNTNVILGEKFITIYGKDYIEDELCGLKFRISPASFYQINRDCAELLYNKAAELVKLGKCDNITDLYCGTGTIGLSIAKQIQNCKLTGIEIVPEAIDNAKLNALTNCIENAEFVCADSSDTNIDVLKKSDAVILDPPRKGITNDLADKLATAGVERIIYISCSPDTLARDVKRFTELGYTCSDVTPFDMFPRTGHVESVICLSRK